MKNNKQNKSRNTKKNSLVNFHSPVSDFDEFYWQADITLVLHDDSQQIFWLDDAAGHQVRIVSCNFVQVPEQVRLQQVKLHRWVSFLRIKTN